MLTWMKILCAVDLSSSSHDAIELAVDLTKRIGAELTLAHVYEEPPVLGVPLPTEAYDAAYERMSRESEAQLSTWRTDAEKRLGRPVGMVLARGEAANEILRIADSGKYDLVVTGTHGRTGIKHAIIGSVAEKVVRHAPCPVLVARPPPAWGD